VKPPKVTRAPGFFDVGELTQEQRHERDLASYEHEQDLYKHVATLSSGAVVILTTFLEKLASRPLWKPLVGVSLASFALSVIGVVVMQLLSVRAVSQDPDRLPSTWGQLIRNWFFVVLGFGGFFAGVVCLTLFGIKNL
jgi:hypothetical protein